MFAEPSPTTQAPPANFYTTFITGQEGVTPAANPCTGGMFFMAYSGALPGGGQQRGSSNPGAPASNAGPPAKSATCSTLAAGQSPTGSFSQWWQGVKTAASMTNDWDQGTGPVSSGFGPDSVQALQMMQSPLVQQSIIPDADAGAE